jgi:DMSO/TMAO reductase YedYZ molybdopterin-dependent catalytic subunit
MNDLTRRRLIGTGLTAAIGAAVGRSVFHIASQNGLIPPDHGGIFGVGETLTYAAQRVLAGDVSLAREFSRRDISTVIPVNGPPPETERYIGLLDGEFRNWRLRVDGLVARRSSFSLADLKSLPAHTQITHQACEEGWSFIAEWTGVRLSHVLELVGIDPRARYVVFFSFDDFWESIDMADALHPQTFLAYAMNGSDMPLEHGAPLRLRVARQLGYKSVKYLGRMIVTDSIAGFGKGLGGISAEYGYSWWAGI